MNLYDVIIYLRTWEDDIRHVDYVLPYLPQSGVKPKMTNSRLFITWVDYSCYVVNPVKQIVDKINIKAVEEAIASTTCDVIKLTQQVLEWIPTVPEELL